MQDAAEACLGRLLHLHVGDFGNADVTVVKAYRVFAVISPLSFTILDKPRPGQIAVLQDENEFATLIHLADTAADARTWLEAHPHENVRVVPVGALEPRTFTYLQDPGHGWLMVTLDDLAGAGMSSADFSSCCYINGDSLALEEDCDMPRFLKRLDERGTPYRLREQHTKRDAHVRRWASNTGARSCVGLTFHRCSTLGAHARGKDRGRRQTRLLPPVGNPRRPPHVSYQRASSARQVYDSTRSAR